MVWSLEGLGAAQSGQEVCEAEAEPHQQQVRAEGQEGQRIQEARVQSDVSHRQQSAQVLLDNPFPGPHTAPCPIAQRGDKDGE